MMKNLDINSTRIFARLIEKMNGRSFIRLFNSPYMPLSVECMGGNFPTVWGMGHFYSLAHHFSQNGDVMYDPEMCFLVVDNRENPEETGALFVVPCSFQNSSLGIYEESISFMSSNVGLYLPKLHQAHLAFAKLWLKNIELQGFLGVGQ